jgi:4,5-DOPA dioxygenase extradiol
VERKSFLRLMAGMGMAGTALKLSALDQLTDGLQPSGRMPVLFMGHGSPMNAIEENSFTAGFRKAAQEIPRPQAILCISAHWETRGTWVTAMERPRTIHDFGGFPKALYEVQYPAPGSPALATETKDLLAGTTVGLDQTWGLDHGAWSVVKHMYPEADEPVIELSLDHDMTAEQHYALARRLAPLRDKGVLVLGSGNLVHNMRLVAWDRLEQPGFAYDWAQEAREKMNALILAGDHAALMDYRAQGQAFQLAIPTSEHYLPLMYALALKRDDEHASLFNDQAVAGSLTMTSVVIRKA